MINACDAGREGELIFTYIYQLTKCKLPVKRAWMQTMTAGGHPRGVQAPARRRADGRPGRRRPLPQRERLADRHQRHARAHQAHVRLARRQRRLGRPRADPHPRDRLRPRTRDPQFQAARPTGASRRPSRSPRAPTRASTSGPTSRRPRTTSTTGSTASGKRRRPRPSLAACQGQPPAAVTEEKKATHAGRAAPLRPDHAAARGQQPLRPARPAHARRSRRRSTSGTR